MTRFENAVVLVTGAGSGIGLAAARRIAAEGGTVVCALQDESQRTAIAGLDGIVLDIRDETSWDAAFRHVRARHGGLDAFVHSAAILRSGKAEDTSRAVWDEIVATNLTGTFLGVQRALPLLRARGGGAVVLMSSLNGIRGVNRSVAYATSKGGIVAMTMALALDHAAENIRVNCVCPGTVDTQMVRDSYARQAEPAAAAQAAADRHPMGRVATPDEIAGVIAFLASRDASFMTGQAIAVDGGRSVR